MSSDKQPEFNPDDLPNREVLKEKEIYQHPQPADAGPALDKDREDKEPATGSEKERQRASKEEGLNQENSDGDAGAFEGFEDQAGE